MRAKLLQKKDIIDNDTDTTEKKILQILHVTLKKSKAEENEPLVFYDDKGEEKATAELEGAAEYQYDIICIQKLHQNIL